MLNHYKLQICYHTKNKTIFFNQAFLEKLILYQVYYNSKHLKENFFCRAFIVKDECNNTYFIKENNGSIS